MKVAIVNINGIADVVKIDHNYEAFRLFKKVCKHKRKLIRYALTVGGYLDEFYRQCPKSMLDGLKDGFLEFEDFVDHAWLNVKHKVNKWELVAGNYVEGYCDGEPYTVVLSVTVRDLQ